MAIEAKDWVKLKIPLIKLGVVGFVSLCCIAAADYFSSQQAESLQQQKQLLSSAQQRFRASGAEKETIITYLPQYEELITNGFVGEERRIEWVELLRELHKNDKLFGISYAINQQEEYQPVFASNLGGFKLYRSVMKLELDMLHEGDILRLTESLGAASTSPFILRDCELTRLNANLSLQLTPNMHAKCELDWLTLREPELINADGVAP